MGPPFLQFSYSYNLLEHPTVGTDSKTEVDKSVIAFRQAAPDSVPDCVWRESVAFGCVHYPITPPLATLLVSTWRHPHAVTLFPTLPTSAPKAQSLHAESWVLSTRR
jgi:hypothetical protein